MSKYGYEGSRQLKPISAWGYVGYSILFSIPVIGWIFWIICVFSDKNINRRNYARSILCHFLLALIFTVATTALLYFNVGDIGKTLRKLDIPYLSEAIEKVEKRLPANRSVPASEPADAQLPANNDTSDSGSVPSGISIGVRKEVKDAIDGYEAFFKEYADFMKKYSSSSNTVSLLSDYTKMMNSYATNMEKWEKLEDDYEMNDAELKYYLDASARIDKMLLDAAQ